MILEGARLAIRDPFQEKSADLNEIEGFRTISTRNGSFLQLHRKDGRGNISIDCSFATDDYFREWFQQIRDLDREDRESILKEISEDTELGVTPEQRLKSLANAQNWVIGLSAILFVVALGVNFAPEPYRNLSAVVLAAGPAAAFYLARRSPLLFTTFKRKSDPRADLTWPLGVCSFGFFLSVNLRSAVLVSMQYALLISALVAVVYFCGYFSTVRTNRSGFSVVIPLLFCALSYSYGLTYTADTAVDDSTVTTYQTAVLNKRISHGKSNAYYLRLSPWGPITDVSDLQVSPRVYGSYVPGDAICLGLHPGALHLQWYEPIDCPSDFSPTH